MGANMIHEKIQSEQAMSTMSTHQNNQMAHHGCLMRRRARMVNLMGASAIYKDSGGGN
jgi:hypothetical protein